MSGLALLEEELATLEEELATLAVRYDRLRLAGRSERSRAVQAVVRRWRALEAEYRAGCAEEAEWRGRQCQE